MSEISINTENYKRTAKRLQKVLKENGLEINLSKAQEIMAQSFGVKNTYEMLNLLNSSTTKSEQKEDLFVQSLNTILKNSNSIKKCFLYTDYGNFILDIVSFNEESYGIYFGATSKPLMKDFLIMGIDEKTATSLVELCSFIPEDKYEGLLFGSKLFNKYCSKKKTHYFKNELLENEFILNSSIYKKRYTVYNKNNFEDEIIGFDKKLNLLQIKSGRHPGFDDFREPDLYLKNKNQILVEYYTEQHSEQPKCYAVRYWYIDSNNFIIEETAR